MSIPNQDTVVAQEPPSQVSGLSIESLSATSVKLTWNYLLT